MPWKSLGEGRFQTSGELSPWMEQLTKWYESIAPQYQVLQKEGMGLYLLVVAQDLGKVAIQHFDGKWFGKSKMEKIQSFLDKGQHVSVMDLLDYLSQNLDCNWLRDHAAVGASAINARYPPNQCLWTEKMDKSGIAVSKLTKYYVLHTRGVFEPSSGAAKWTVAIQSQWNTLQASNSAIPNLDPSTLGAISAALAHQAVVSVPLEEKVALQKQVAAFIAAPYFDLGRTLDILGAMSECLPETWLMAKLPELLTPIAASFR